MKEFFIRFLKGAIIGVAMIIPGVSSGTVAVLLNEYDKLLGAIEGLRRNFKKRFLYLLPLLSGALVGVAATFFPLKYALEYAPFPTVMLFVGCMSGSLPKLLKEGLANGFSKSNAIPLILSCAVVIGVCFIPNVGSVELGVNMPIYGYILLLTVGVLASCALVIPGISGSMVLLILGYYQPILDTVSALKTNAGHSLAVLALFAVGIIIGIFSIAKLMKFLLKKFPRGTYWAIIGFVVGSFPALFITFDYANANLSGVQIAVGIILCAIGAAAVCLFTAFTAKRKTAIDECAKNSQNGDNI